MRGAVEGSRREPSNEAEIVPWAQEVRMVHMLGFFESFPFFQTWKEAVGPVVLTCVCVLKRSEYPN